MLAVTTHSQWGTKPLIGALPDPPVCPVKRRRRGLATPDGTAGGLPVEALEATLGWGANALEQ